MNIKDKIKTIGIIILATFVISSLAFMLVIAMEPESPPICNCTCPEPTITVQAPNVTVQNQCPDVYVQSSENAMEQRYTEKLVSIAIINFLKETDSHYANILEVMPEYQGNGVWLVRVKRQSIAIYYQELIFDEEMGIL